MALIRCTCEFELLYGDDSSVTQIIVLYDPECDYIIHRLQSGELDEQPQ